MYGPMSVVQLDTLVRECPIPSGSLIYERCVSVYHVYCMSVVQLDTLVRVCPISPDSLI